MGNPVPGLQPERFELSVDGPAAPSRRTYHAAIPNRRIRAGAGMRERLPDPPDEEIAMPVPSRRLLLLIVLVALSRLSVDRPVVNAAAQNRERIFAVVHDATGAPVADLTPADFVIRIDGADQEVISVARTTEPPSIVLLTDQLGLTNSYPVTDLREALLAFVRTIRTGSRDARFALLTFDGSPRVVARLDTSPPILEREIERLVGVSPTSVLIDGVQQAARTLMDAPSERRIIVNVFSAYRADQSSVRTDELGETLRVSGASLWSIEAVADVGWQVTQGPARPSANPGANLGNPVQVSPQLPDTASAGNYASAPRELVVSEGSTRSGGTRLTVKNRQELRLALDQLAQLLVAQYEVVYGPAQGGPRSQRLVGVRRPNVRVLAPSWISR
jgi:VWFA-related protein